ncbi:MAG: tetratricopeptide repeat protein [Syntrophales bacterium]
MSEFNKRSTSRAKILLLCACALLLSCAGDPARSMPAHLTSGAEQIKKGNAFYQKGCYRTAQEHFYRAHDLYSASDQPGGVAMSLNNIGSVFRASGDAQSALLFFDEAVSIYTDIGDRAGLRQALSNKAAALIDKGDLDEAEALIEKASGIYPDENRKPFIPLLRNKGVLLTKQKKYWEAEEVLRRALVNSNPDNLPERATLHFALGNLMLETGRAKESIEHFQAALSADRISGFYRGMADDLSRLGQVCFQSGDYRAAAGYWKRSARIYYLVGLKKEAEQTMDQLRTAAQKAGVDTDVVEHFARRWEEGKKLENPCEE